MGTLRQDLRLALRSLVSHRSVSLLVVTSLALALAGNTAVFSLVNSLLLRPLPYENPERLTMVWQSNRQEPGDQSLVSPANFVDYRQRSRSFTAMEAFRLGVLNLTGGDAPEAVGAVTTTPGALQLLGVGAIHGRTFVPEEGQPGRNEVAVVSYQLWQRRFAGDPALVGSTLRLDGVEHTVVGILPEDFEFLVQDMDVWVPLALDPAQLPRSERSLLVMARLAPGVRPEEARAEMDGIARQLEREHPEANAAFGAMVLTLKEQFPGPTDRQLFALLQGAMILLLLIACANIANLLLARGQDRQREIALRTTMGAGRLRIVRQLLVESLVLASAGAVVGLVLSAWAIELTADALVSTVPRMALPVLDWRVATFSLALAAVAGLLFGLMPALQSSRPDLADTLKEGARGASGRRRLLSRALVVAEVTLALVMLCGTGLLVRSMTIMRNLDPGFRSDHLLTFILSVPERSYPEDAQVAAFFDHLLGELEGLPGVTAATATNGLPRSRGNSTATFTVEGRPVPEGSQPPTTLWLSVPTNYLAAMEIPLMAGRSFESGDDADAVRVAVVNQALARRFWPDRDPLGHRITVHGEPREIVGIAGDVVQSRLLGQQGIQPLVYLPMAQLPVRSMSVVVRADGDPLALADPVRRQVWSLDAALPVDQVRTMEEHIALQFVGARVLTRVLGGFALVALVLAALGIYGVVAYSVAQRTREIGIRMAIGARRRDVVRQVTRQGLLLVGIGLLVGAPGVLLVTRFIASVLANVAPVAVVSVPAVALLLAAVAAMASYLPARRAAGLDPVAALRNE